MIVPVTEVEYQKGQSVFDATEGIEFVPVADDEDTLAAFIRVHQCRAVVLGVARYSGPLYDALPAGAILLRFGVGTDGIDFEKTRARGLHVANTPGALDQSVAEHTIWLMGALVRHVVTSDKAFRSAIWASVTGDELADLKLAIIGLGNIGYQVARIAHGAFGVETLICELASEQQIAARHGVSCAEMKTLLGYSCWNKQLGEVLEHADIVSVHLPLIAQTRGLFSESVFARCKTGCIFVNTSRGGLVVEEALVAALRSGKVRAAALDVFEQEPYKPSGSNADLRTIPNVVLTPHVASNTRAANRRMAETVVHNLKAWAADDLNRVYVVA